MSYAELTIASNFTFLTGASQADELVRRAAELGYRAIGITDVNTFAGIVRMHIAAREFAIRLVVGVRLRMIDSADLFVWPTDRAAYGRLCRLLTLGKRRAEKGRCQISVADFITHCDGSYAAILPPDPISPGFHRQIQTLKNILGPRLSIAAFSLLESDPRTRLENLAELSRSTGVPLMAGNDVHYHDPSRRALQDVLTCIRHGCTIHDAGRRLFPNRERYLKSSAQMHALFADYPQAIDRALEVAAACTFNLDELKYEYPRELAPDGKSPMEYLTELTWSGAAERYLNGLSTKVRDLIDHELELIGELKIEAYFLTVYDLVRFARSRGILCQGRGSAANSAVCYCIGVTSVDPERIDVLFERFVSAARNEPPDIDVDFEHERREEVLQYLYDKYGRDRAGMTAEVITYRGRSAIRDIGKAMGLGLDMVEQIAKRLDWWDHGRLIPEKIREAGLDPSDRTVHRIIELTAEILGFPRHLGQHVGGMVMTSGLLCEMVPIENAAMENRTVIEWDKQDIDNLGILKIDVLALGMLTCISKALALINHYSIKPTDCHPWDKLQLHTIPPEDPTVYDMISNADTVGVFQIESRAQMTMLPRLRPRKFYDLVIEVAIVRPGPIQGDMVHPYLRRRNGEEKVTYPSAALRQVLEKTLGVPLFQEQAMRVAMVAAGFSAGEADQLRRAMAAWRKSGALENFQKKILDGMLRNGYTRQYADQCFNMLKGFGEYGFPESHSASFALLVYVSSWIKCHHPAAFCCALLNSQPMGFYAPAQIVRDAQEHDVQVLPIDINFSDWDCLLEESSLPLKPTDCHPRAARAVRLGFRQLRGFSEIHAQKIMRVRAGGKFNSIKHFVQSTHLPDHVLQRLAHADAFSSLGLSRRQALWEVMRCQDAQAGLFDYVFTEDEPRVELPRMPVGQEVMTDYQTAGLSLKRHPLSLLREKLAAQGVTRAADLSNTKNGQWVSVAGIVLIRQRPGTASGIVFETLEDETGVANLVIRPKIFDRHRAAARHAKLLRADGYVEKQGQVIHVMALKLTDLSEWVREGIFYSRDFR